MTRRAGNRPFSELWDIRAGVDKRAFIRDLLKHTYAGIAEHFQSTRRFPWEETVRFADSLSEKACVLDMGCGGGRNAVFLAKRGMTVLGIDLSPELLALAGERACRENVAELCDFCEGDLTELPFEDNIFHGILCIASLHHLPTVDDRMKCLREMNRVLDHGGRGLISVWRRDLDRFGDLLAVWEEHPLFEKGDVMVPWRSGEKEYPRYYHLFSLSEFHSLLCESPLVIIEVYQSGQNNYAVVERG